MKKEVYIKPSFKIMDIFLNDLCVGSECLRIDVKIPEGAKSDRTNVYIQGDLADRNMWDFDF